uniref:Uncharacterized protein n=1 Tax=Tanacetum cinerariifolium TaxID=118510 RepID=A0A699IQC6_TANCI|nr:hypothetical protein [Tanacetum cinerariifolium]
MVIKKLKEKIKSLSGNMKEDKIKKELEETETINIKLDHRVTEELVILHTQRCHDDDADKDEEPSAGPDRGSKRRREGKEPESASAPTKNATRSAGRSTQGSKSRQMSASESATVDEPMQTTFEMEEPTHLEFGTSADDQPIKKVYKATTDQLDWVNHEGQQYPHNLLKPLPLIQNNRSRRVIHFDHFITNDLEYLREGASSRKYTTSVTKTKAADYGHIKWIEDLVPRTIWIQEPIGCDKKHRDLEACGRPTTGDGTLTDVRTALDDRLKGIQMQMLPQSIWKKNQLDWVNHEGQQYPHNLLKPLPLIQNNRSRRVIHFDHFITNDLEYLREGASSRKYTTSVTKTKAADYGHIKWIEDLVPRTIWIQEPIGCDKIIDVTELKIVEWHNYKHLYWITVRRDDDKIYKFKEGDFKRLRIQDIEDMLLLLVQGKLTNLIVKERFAFNVFLRMFTGSIVIQRRVEDLQLGVESYQKKLNLTKPDTDGTLTDVRTALDDRLKGIQMQMLPQSIWKKSDKDREAAMI